MVKVILDKSACISCGTCAATCPDLFEMREGLAHLKGASPLSDVEELVLKDQGCAQDAADLCPVNCIQVE